MDTRSGRRFDQRVFQPAVEILADDRVVHLAALLVDHDILLLVVDVLLLVLRSLADLQAAIRYGAVQRLRPKFMTVATTFCGLVPIMWSIGTGSDVMKRIAAPLIGGIFTSFLLELLVYPAIYQIWKWNFELKKQL